MGKKKLILSGDGLSFDEVAFFLNELPLVELSKSAKEKMRASRAVVEKKLTDGKAHYGINTGFGKLATSRISLDQLKELQENLIFSHAVGVGEHLPVSVARLALLLHANCLSRGYSGIRVEVVESMLDFLNHQITPVIPEQGSVGASGDLAPQAHMALALMGEGDVYYQGALMPAAEALQQAGLKPVRLEAKEGLSLINGIEVSGAIACEAILAAEKMIKLADIAAAISMEGDRCSFSPLDVSLVALRPQNGIQRTAHNLRELLANSEINQSHADCHRVQDPYSFRCTPQVHGAVKEAYYFAKNILANELKGVTDNPLVFVDQETIISGGNFHGQTIAMAADFLAIAVAELGSIAERRVFVLNSPLEGEIPSQFLTNEPGLNSGMAIPHVVMASVMMENRSLAIPASIDSASTFGGQEDHVSQSCWAARKLKKVVSNIEEILSIELLAGMRAIKLASAGLKAGEGVAEVYQLISDNISLEFSDRQLPEQLHVVRSIVRNGEVLKRVENKIGALEL